MIEETPQPIPMLLFCPNCAEQHIDEPKPGQLDDQGQPWLNPPHRSHRCDFCQHVWRPADVPTNGMRAIQTTGKRDENPFPRYRALGLAQIRIKSLEDELATNRRRAEEAVQIVNRWQAAVMKHWKLDESFDPVNPDGMIAKIVWRFTKDRDAAREDASAMQYRLHEAIELAESNLEKLFCSAVEGDEDSSEGCEHCKLIRLKDNWEWYLEPNPGGRLLDKLEQTRTDLAVSNQQQQSLIQAYDAVMARQVEMVKEKAAIVTYVRIAEAALDEHIGGPEDAGEKKRSDIFAAEAVANGVRSVIAQIETLNQEFKADLEQMLEKAGT